MRPEPNLRIERLRRVHPTLGEGIAGTNAGYFEVGIVGNVLRVLSSGSGGEWEHVSVSLPDRTPTWDEMCKVKRLFWGDDETVVQFHPAKQHYVNVHPYVLHLWKRRGVNAKLPPKELI